MSAPTANTKRMDTKTLTSLAMFTALAYVVMYLSKWLPQVAGFLQFELKENMDKIDFYKDQFENLKEIDSRTIGGIEMQGRTYKTVGMEWIEYYGELPSGIWVTCKISRTSIEPGSEGSAILDSVKIN